MLATARYDRVAFILSAWYLQNNGSYGRVITQNNHCPGWEVYLVQLKLSCMLARTY